MLSSVISSSCETPSAHLFEAILRILTKHGLIENGQEMKHNFEMACVDIIRLIECDYGFKPGTIDQTKVILKDYSSAHLDLHLV